MATKRRRVRGRAVIDISPGILEWLNGKRMAELDRSTQAKKYFLWSDYAGGLQGLVEYCQQNRLMPRVIPPEVQQALRVQPGSENDGR